MKKTYEFLKEKDLYYIIGNNVKFIYTDARTGFMEGKKQKSLKNLFKNI